MRKFSYLEQGELEPYEVEVKEEDILENYFPYWSWRMKEAGKEDLINKENCLEDWLVVNWWAREIK